MDQSWMLDGARQIGGHLNGLRQPVETEHAEHRRECRTQNRELERDGYGEFHREQRLAADHQRIIDRAGPPHQPEREGSAERSAAHHDPAEFRSGNSQGFVNAVHRERCEGV
jgi:hypothetical protein